MGNVILDLGSNVNILPKKTWEVMGEPTLGYSNIQLKLENQQRVIPIGILEYNNRFRWCAHHNIF
jgi:hypothetical protein